MGSNFNFQPYQAGVFLDNASLNDGHVLQQVLGMGRWISSLVVEHPIQGRERFINEFTALEAAERSGTLASAGTIKGMNQRTKIEGEIGGEDAANANSAMAGSNDPADISLTTLGLPLDFPVFLSIDVKFQPSDEPTRFLVAPILREYRRLVGKGDPEEALRSVFTNPVNAFRAKYQQLSVEGVCLDIVFGRLGVQSLVLQGLPK